MSIERPSRLVVAWASGPRDERVARAVVGATRERTAGRVGIGWNSDSWEPYAAVIDEIYRDRFPSGVRANWWILRPTPGLRLTQTLKQRRGRRLVRVEVRAPIGEPLEQPYTVHVERFNGVLRDRLACLTRKTHAFAKDVATWDAALGLAIFEHNWIRPHLALRQPVAAPVDGRRYRPRTPAMAIGLTDHPWTLHEFLTYPVYQRQ